MARRPKKRKGRFGMFTQTIVNTGDTKMMRDYVKLSRLGMRTGVARGKVKGVASPLTYVNPQGKPADLGIGARSKAAKVVPDPYLDAKFPSKGQISKERLAVDALIAKLRGESPPERNIILEKNEHYRIRLFFNVQHDLFFFIEEIHQTQMYRRSLNYSTRQKALDVYQSDEISWFAFVKPEIV